MTALLMLAGLATATAGSAGAAETQTLTVNRAGDGYGSITSTPAGIEGCDPTCTASFETGTKVRLDVLPTLRSSFVGWTGDCSGKGFSCELTMDAAKSVTATFDSIAPQPTAGISKPLVKPATVKRKPGWKGRFVVRVENSGDTVLGKIKVCAKVPARYISLDAACRQMAGLAYGDSGKLIFGYRVKPKAKAGQKLKVEFTATTADLRPTRSSATIKVK